MHIKKGDYVQVISGSEITKRGKVLRIITKKNKVVVEGVNYIHKHLRKSQKNPRGGRVDMEAPINVSNVMIYCPHCQKPTRCRYEYQDITKKKKQEGEEKKKKVRCCNGCDRHI